MQEVDAVKDPQSFDLQKIYDEMRWCLTYELRDEFEASWRAEVLQWTLLLQYSHVGPESFYKQLSWVCGLNERDEVREAYRFFGWQAAEGKISLALILIYLELCLCKLTKCKKKLELNG